MTNLKKKLGFLGFIALGFLVTMGILFSVRFYEKKKADENRTRLIISENQKIELYDLNGERFLSEDLLKGKILLVFFSADCSACVSDFEQINPLYASLEKKVRFLAISQDSKEKTQIYAKETGAQFPILLDQDKKFFNLLKLPGVPAKMLVNNGVIEEVFWGRFGSQQEIKERFQLP